MILFSYVFLIILPIGFYMNSKNSQLSRTSSIVYSSLIYFLVIGLVSYNNDWTGYIAKFEGESPTKDLFYKYSYMFFRDRGYSFNDFYMFNQLLNTFLLVNFIRIFKSNSSLIVVVLVLILIGPTSSILLRFYTSFLFFLNGAAFILYKNSKMLGVTFIVLSLLSHFSSIIFLLFFIIYKYKLFNKSVFSILLIAGFIALIKSILFFILNSFGPRFGFYLINSTPTLLGSLLAVLPFTPWIFLVLYKHNYIMRKNVRYDDKYIFLYSISLFPILLIFLSLSLQIVLYRFIEPFIIVFVIYLCYAQKYIFNKNTRFYLMFYIFSVFTFYTKYYLHLLISKDSEWLLHYTEILESNLLNIF